MKPFDLEAAKRGEPIVIRNGGNAKFIAYVPEARPYQRCVYLIGDAVLSTNEEGRAQFDAKNDIYMAPKKRTVWVNFYTDGTALYYESENEQTRHSNRTRIGGKAYLVEIEE